MSIDALVSGMLLKAPQERTSKTGRKFATVMIKASQRDGSVVICSAIAFKDSIVAELLSLSEGDSIAASGELVASVYQAKTGENKPSLDLLIHHLTSAYYITRKKAATQPQPSGVDPEFDDKF